ncbi:MAG: dUTP diphosphatase [Patescibacteria group bacterium]
MKVRIKRVDKTLPLPEYKTTGAVAVDLSARLDVKVPARSVAYVPLNVIIAPPEGHMIFIAARSSLHKRGLMMANSVGIGDRDFSGNDDEYTAALYNFTDMDVQVKRGERIVQALLFQYGLAEWEEVDDMEKGSRGGFGTTGHI